MKIGGRTVEQLLELTYLTNQRRNIVYLNDDLVHDSDEDELTDFTKMWEEGFHVEDIARALNRHPDEVVLMVVHQKRRLKIQERRNGLQGRRMTVETHQ